MYNENIDIRGGGGGGGNVKKFNEMLFKLMR